jgi:hypothetical protein
MTNATSTIKRRTWARRLALVALVFGAGSIVASLIAIVLDPTAAPAYVSAAAGVFVVAWVIGMRRRTRRHAG